MAFAAFLKRKRYSTSKPQSYIKVSQKQLATIMAKQDEDKQERPSIVFTGKDIVQWFKFDRQVTRYAKKKYGGGRNQGECAGARLKGFRTFPGVLFRWLA